MLLVDRYLVLKYRPVATQGTRSTTEFERGASNTGKGGGAVQEDGALRRVGGGWGRSVTTPPGR